MKQLSMIKKEKSDFGGSLLKGKRKSKRPISTKKPMHLVLQSEKAKGRFALAPSDQRLKMLAIKMAQKFGVKLYTCALNWSHAHLVIRVKNRRQYNSFIRALTGAMVLRLKAPKGFFTVRPFSKIGTWGRQFKNWLNYTEKNELQAWGIASSSKIGGQTPTNLKKRAKEKLRDILVS